LVRLIRRSRICGDSSGDSSFPGTFIGSSGLRRGLGPVIVVVGTERY